MISLRKGGGATIFHLPESFGILRRKTREFATWMHRFRTYESRVNPRSLSSKKLRAKKGDSLDASFDCSIQGSRGDDRLKSIEIQEYSILALPWTTSKILEFIHDWLSIRIYSENCCFDFFWIWKSEVWNFNDSMSIVLE